MRNAEVKIGVSCRVIYPRVEGTVRLEKLRLKFHLALQINRADRRSHLNNFVHKFLLRRDWEIHARLRA
jgi:hypothetical protein